MRSQRSIAFFSAVTSGFVAACGLFVSFDDYDTSFRGAATSDAAAEPDANAALDANADGAAESGPLMHPSCLGLAATCGGGNDCCASKTVKGGMFNRENDAAAPAVISDFELDVYEVTVGRFREFVKAGKGTQASPPAPGDGAHPKIPSSGWDSSFDTNLGRVTFNLTGALSCGTLQAWTDEPAGNENRPIQCVTWFEAFAFCAWDGGRLPTEAEWSYAASGGSEQREYPWGPGIDPSKAAYGCQMDDAGCSFANLLPVGSKSPQGDGRWGHADLVGSVHEWGLDWFADPQRSAVCNDCADLEKPDGGASRVTRGGSFFTSAVDLRTREGHEPTFRRHDYGFRCARSVVAP